mmetsp:Transcript_65588/g.182365  ORF Transcript_65588/g.182365 Transcript_65588/m.182365 type:complete len:367 (+) Transcript_65588:1-1101(+)
MQSFVERGASQQRSGAMAVTPAPEITIPGDAGHGIVRGGSTACQRPAPAEQATPRKAKLRDVGSLPFPILYSTLVANGAKGGATKYALLQFLNYARWTAQEHSVNFPRAVRICMERNVRGADGRLQPLGLIRMWKPSITLLNESVHWAMKVPLSLCLYEQLREPLGIHAGLFLAVAMNTVAEVAVTGPTERLGVHVALNRNLTYRDSYELTRQHRPNFGAALWNGGCGLWVRNFSWNFAFFEWKRLFHNALDRPDTAPAWLEWHFDWLRRMEAKDSANVLTFEAACLATYLTFFNMAGDNVKTKMSADPKKFPTVRYTVSHIYQQHGLMGFTRGGLFKGIYLVAGSTIAIGLQERLTAIMSKLVGS